MLLGLSHLAGTIQLVTLLQLLVPTVPVNHHKAPYVSLQRSARRRKPLPKSMVLCEKLRALLLHNVPQQLANNLHLLLRAHFAPPHVQINSNGNHLHRPARRSRMEPNQALNEINHLTRVLPRPTVPLAPSHRHVPHNNSKPQAWFPWRYAPKNPQELRPHRKRKL